MCIYYYLGPISIYYYNIYLNPYVSFFFILTYIYLFICIGLGTVSEKLSVLCFSIYLFLHFLFLLLERSCYGILYIDA